MPDACRTDFRLKNDIYFMTDVEDFTLKHLTVLRKQAIIFTMQLKKMEYLPVSHKKGI